MTITTDTNTTPFEWAGRCGCEVPERPLGFGAYICARPTCTMALRASIARYPNLGLVIKWGLGARTVIQAATFVSLLEGVEEGNIKPVAAYLGRDYPDSEDEYGPVVQYVREIFVQEGTGLD